MSSVCCFTAIFENLTNYINKDEQKPNESSTMLLSDEEAELARETSSIPRFLTLRVENAQARPMTKNLNETLERIFKNIEASRRGMRARISLKARSTWMSTATNWDPPLQSVTRSSSAYERLETWRWATIRHH